MRLHRAAQAGSTEAQLALSDRLFKGLGMPRNCPLALTYARQAAAQIAADVEKVCQQGCTALCTWSAVQQHPFHSQPACMQLRSQLGAMICMQELRFMPAPSPVDLRERSINARYVSAEDLENNPQVIHMEEDMALRYA
jgi:hypothetical protein